MGGKPCAKLELCGWEARDYRPAVEQEVGKGDVSLSWKAGQGGAFGRRHMRIFGLAPNLHRFFQNHAGGEVEELPAAWWRDNCCRRRHMLYWALVFLVVALVSGLLGFGMIAGTSLMIAKVLFWLFLILFLVSLVMGASGRRRVP